MKEQFDRNLRTDKNRQCITGGIFYCRDSAGFSVSASNKLSCNLTGQCFEIGNKNIPPNRWQQAKKDTNIMKQTILLILVLGILSCNSTDKKAQRLNENDSTTIGLKKKS